ncbi:helix-turn-helix transcriptional regulator [Saccharothrix obliqua]|uniref:helix-turn-helix transcriptional regulator n=1 Tax=Saccharothrix obliqua TaxID=2861747 RepID=UPI001C5DE849|nr:LuxR family transcriptional regulator [Saccharothrix obliqua]MBW4718457.1 LuxR family transcriptional regulator [Saccharothrix obliqua]
MTNGGPVGFREALDWLAASTGGARLRGRLVVGGPGAGKSRLLGRLAGIARQRGVAVVAAAGDGRDVPFSALRAGARRAGDVPTAAGQDALLLLRALLHSFLEPGRGPGTSPTERHRVYRTVGDLVGALAKPAGLLIVVDDAHLADSGSLELLRHLVRWAPEGDVLVVAAHRPGPSPFPADGVVLAPFAVEPPLLPSEDLLVAQAVAVLGSAEPRLVAAVAATPLPEVHAALARLTARGVLSAGTEPAYRETRLREAVHASVDWLPTAHARAIRALVEDNAPVAVRAHHAAHAEVGDLTAVADLLGAADVSAAIAPAVAVRRLTEALGLVPDALTATRQHVLRKLVTATQAAGLPDDHHAAARAVLATHPPDGVEIAVRAAAAQRAHGRHADATALLTAAEPHTARDRLLRDIALADHAEAAARAFGDPALLARALTARLATPPYDPHALAEAAELADRTPDCPVEALLDLARAEVTLERPADAVRHTERAIRLARLDRDDLLVPLWQVRGEALERLGRLVEADECFTDAAEAAALAGLPTSLALAGKARVALWRGATETGLELAAEAVAGGTPRAHVALALALLHAGEPDRCADHLAEVGVAAVRDDPAAEVEWCALAALAEGARDRVAEAARWAERARRVADGLPAGLRGGYARLAEVGALRHTDPAAAATAATDAATAFEALGNLVHAGRARLIAAALHRAAGWPRPERRERERARDLLEACEPGLSERLAGTWVPVSDCGLTEREHMVLTVLAEGLTADAIARRMDISPRTVHRHLQHLYRKLGTTDRLSAVLRAQSLGLLTGDSTPVDG